MRLPGEHIDPTLRPDRTGVSVPTGYRVTRAVNPQRLAHEPHQPRLLPALGLVAGVEALTRGDAAIAVGSSPAICRAWMDGAPAVRKQLASVFRSASFTGTALVRWWMAIRAVLVVIVTLLVVCILQWIAATADRRIAPLDLIGSESSRPKRLV